MLTSLWLPILLSAVALFFASFLSWMVVQLHRDDWRRLDREDEFLTAVRNLQVPLGSHMFPCAETPEQMKSEEFQRKCAAGPNGVLTIFPKTNMGMNLVLTFLYFLAVSFCLAYLATLALAPGAGFMPVFRFVSTAALLTFLAAIVQHAIWFKNRIVGHVIESVAYAAIVGAIFAAMWPSG
jgi:hypothetical protein